MNREIKFRGRPAEDILEDYDGDTVFTVDEWVYGSLIVSGDYCYIAGPIVDAGPDGLIHEWWVEVDRETVGQYTGLKDKNGVKIYEGDILRVTDGADEINEQNSDTGIGEVTWLDKWPLWYVSNVNNGLGDLNYSGYLEVIGNCHDNPELLEV